MGVHPGGGPESLKRLRSFRFRDVGARTPRTDRPIYEYAPPSIKTSGAGYLIDMAHYQALRGAVVVYQAGIAADAQQMNAAD